MAILNTFAVEVTGLRMPFVEGWLAASGGKIHRSEEVLVLADFLGTFGSPLLTEGDASVLVEDAIVLAATSSRRLHLKLRFVRRMGSELLCVYSILFEKLFIQKRYILIACSK